MGIELVTALGLSASSGLNAYIPMLIVGMFARYTSVVDLPSSWRWLENPWVILILAVLLVVEVVADKVPAVDHVNDILQTVVRPTSGGIVVGAAGFGGEALVADPQAFVSDGGWVPVLSGALVALAVHLTKAGLRGVANAATAGVAAPVLSTVEDGSAIALSLAALLAPVLVVILLGVGVWAIVAWRRRLRQRAALRDGPGV